MNDLKFNIKTKEELLDAIGSDNILFSELQNKEGITHYSTFCSKNSPLLIKYLNNKWNISLHDNHIAQEMNYLVNYKIIKIYITLSIYYESLINNPEITIEVIKEKYKNHNIYLNFIDHYEHSKNT